MQKISVKMHGLRLRSCRHESESGFPFTGCLSLVQAYPHEWSVHGHLHKQLTQRCLLTISSEIKSSECFAKKVTIFYYIVNNFTDCTPLILKNLTVTIYDVTYVLRPV